MNAIDEGNDEELFSYVDKEYIGRFLANLYFFYEPHHIQGDNNKWLHNFEKDKFYPIARNEGVCERIGDILKFDEGLFQVRPLQSGTYDFYKRAVCNDSIRFYRNKELNRLVKNKDAVLTRLDSIYNEYYPLHRYYNKSFMNVRYRQAKIRDVITYNTEIIDKYLKEGEVVVAFDIETKELRLVTDLRVPIKLNIPKLSFSKEIKGIDFSLEEGRVEKKVVENIFSIDEVINKGDMKFINMVSGDTIRANQIIFNYF